MNHVSDQEYELRYKLLDRVGFEDTLRVRGARLVSQEHLIDHWFIPNEIKSADEQKKWFDDDRGCSVRVREFLNVDGSRRSMLGTKRITGKLGHDSLAEAEVEVADYERTKPILLMMDRKEFLIIDKERTLYKLEDFEIAIDVVKDFGAGVEIEYRGGLTGDEALKAIQVFASSLSLSAGDRYEKSITVSAMKELANY